MTVADEKTLEILFTEARSQNGWTDQVVTDAELQEAYDIAKWGPTSMNIHVKQRHGTACNLLLHCRKFATSFLNVTFGAFDNFMTLTRHPPNFASDVCGNGVEKLRRVTGSAVAQG